jgi:exopolysaccharide production protein ExoZ
LVLAFIGFFVPDSAPAALKEWSDNIIIEFAFGVSIAYCFERYGRVKSASIWIALVVMLSGFGFLYYLNLPVKPFAIPRAISAGIPAATIVAACVLLLPAHAEGKIPKWLVALGDSSYSLYLSHRFIQRPVQIAFKHGGLDSMNYVGGLYLGSAVLVAFIVGHLVYLKIEKPLLKKLRELVSRKYTKNTLLLKQEV